MTAAISVTLYDAVRFVAIYGTAWFLLYVAVIAYFTYAPTGRERVRDHIQARRDRRAVGDRRETGR